MTACFEIEWMAGQGHLPDEGYEAALGGGPCGASRLIHGLDHLREIADVLDGAGLGWPPLHPEDDGPGRMELSRGPPIRSQPRPSGARQAGDPARQPEPGSARQLQPAGGRSQRPSEGKAAGPTTETPVHQDTDAPQACSRSRTGISSTPFSLREYSTFGGTSAYTRRCTTPACSSSRS